MIRIKIIIIKKKKKKKKKKKNEIDAIYMGEKL